MAKLTIYFVQAFLYFCHALNCPKNTVQYGSSSCLAIVHKQEPQFNRQLAQDECNQLKFPGQWHLPKVDSYEKMHILRLTIPEMTGQDAYWIWLGLQRDSPARYEEALDRTAWEDKSKWRWPDGSTLESTFQHSRPPWIPEAEPDNGFYEISQKAGDMELCVVAVTAPRQLVPVPIWLDKPCEVSRKHLEEIPQASYILVCESSNATLESSSVADTSSDESTGQDRDPLEDQVFLGSVIMAVITLVSAAGLFCLCCSAEKTEEVPRDDNDPQSFRSTTGEAASKKRDLRVKSRDNEAHG